MIPKRIFSLNNKIKFKADDEQLKNSPKKELKEMH